MGPSCGWRGGPPGGAPGNMRRGASKGAPGHPSNPPSGLRRHPPQWVRRSFHNLSTARRWSPVQLEGASYRLAMGFLLSGRPLPARLEVVFGKRSAAEDAWQPSRAQNPWAASDGILWVTGRWLHLSKQNPEVTAKEGPHREPPELVLLPWGVGAPPSAGLNHLRRCGRSGLLWEA